MVLTFGASFVLSALSAQKYLQEQLYLKNTDNATSLALSMSQVADDPVTVELLLSAQFDSGHYQFIRLVDPHGKVLIEHSNPANSLKVPGWFQRLVPLQAAAGVAQVQNGWKQFGTLFLQSHSRFAYESLWQETLNLSFWFLGVATLAGIIGTLAIRSITRPLGEVVQQAEAIGARRFITVAEPSIPELRTLVGAMNGLSTRVKRMLEDESERLEVLRKDIEHDPLTGLLLRAPFLKRTESVLLRDDASAAGGLVIARVPKLDDMNRSLGREATDQLLRRIGEQLSVLCPENSERTVGRISGADFALLAPGNSAAFDLAQEVAGALHLAIDDPGHAGEYFLPVGGTAMEPGETLSRLLSRTDAALITAERNGTGEVQITLAEVQPRQITDLEGWRVSLNQALDADGLKLAHFPVVDVKGQLLHLETPVRLRIGEDWLAAGSVLPWAARLGLMPRVDFQVVERALEEIAGQGKPLGVNISPEALCDPGFRTALIQKLHKAPELANSLWLEVSESGAVRHVAEFRKLVEVLKPLGAKVGIEHVGPQFSRIGALHDLGLDYVKIDSSLIRGIHENPGSQAFLRGLCMIVHTIGLTAIAEGVQSIEEVDCLVGLGVDGMTGPGVTLTSTQ
jgi:EAL domain-containing protein (putative c-di-GMP-specific phosphodiesterase class I)/GGDEF domain-containing protein